MSALEEYDKYLQILETEYRPMLEFAKIVKKVNAESGWEGSVSILNPDKWERQLKYECPFLEYIIKRDKLDPTIKFDNVIWERRDNGEVMVTRRPEVIRAVRERMRNE